MILSPKHLQGISQSSDQVFTTIASGFIVYKMLSLIDTSSDALSVQEKHIELPLCNLYFINCLGVHAAYLFEVPGFYVSVEPAYIKIRRSEALERTLFRETRFVHQDKYLNILHSDDGGTLISPNNLQRIIKPEMVRKTTSKD